MSGLDDFDRYVDVHPELERHEAFAQWLATETGETVVGREVDGDGIVVATPDTD